MFLRTTSYAYQIIVTLQNNCKLDKADFCKTVSKIIYTVIYGDRRLRCFKKLCIYYANDFTEAIKLT